MENLNLSFQDRLSTSPTDPHPTFAASGLDHTPWHGILRLEQREMDQAQFTDHFLGAMQTPSLDPRQIPPGNGNSEIESQVKVDK